jgi:CBS-domain-containing membrane protein
MRLEEAVGLTVADVMHSRFSVLPGDASVADVREWFDGSTSHRMALLADDGRYVACLVPGDLDGADPGQRAAGFAREWPTVTPDQPAKRGEELGLSTDARRVPVVDDEGRLLGIVAITTDLQGFCGT